MFDSVPKFQPSKSPQLDEALEYYRQNLFIPFSLPRRQRQTIFSTKYKQRLLDEPISVNISETEEYTLRPIPLEEVRTKAKIQEVLNLMITSNDFQNLGPFLRGVHSAGMRIESSKWQKLIRKIGGADQLQSLLTSAQRQREIGLDLQQIDVLESLFYQFHVAAAKAEYQGEKVTKSLNLAKQAVDLIEFYGIHNLEAADKPSKLPASQPFVIATLLELSAARASAEFGGKDQDGETLGYVRKLLANWNLADLSPKPAEDINRWIGRAVTICNSLKLSLSIHDLTLDKALHSSVKSHFTQAKNVLAKQLKENPDESKFNMQSKVDLETAKKLLQK